MLNGNEKPNKPTLPAPPVAILIGAVLFGHGILANLITMPKWIGAGLWIGSVVVFLHWLITGSRK